MNEYERYDATGLAALVARKEVSPHELLDAAIARVERVNASVNAVVTRHYDEARAAIANGLPPGPLRGVPFLLKDLIALLDGTVTTNGCRFFADNRADHDSEWVTRCKRGGLAIFGKTNTSEFGLTATAEHVITRSVRDSAAFLDLTNGPDLGAPYFATPPQTPFLAAVGAAGPALRIGLVTRTPAGEPVDAECENAVNGAAHLLARLGHRIDELSLADAGLGPSFRVITAGNTRAAIEFYAEKVGRQPGPDDLEGLTRAMFEEGARASATDYARAVLAVHRAGRLFAGLFRSCDLILTPTLPKPPQPIGTFSMMTGNLDSYGREVGHFTSFTAIVNVAGNPAASLPLHWTAQGLPVGVQLIARYGDEATLLRVSAQVEEARPWFDRRAAL